jgi:hypothetical protein
MNIIMKKFLFNIWTAFILILVAPAAIIHIWYQVWYFRHFVLKGIDDLPVDQQKKVRESIRRKEEKEFQQSLN